MVERILFMQTHDFQKIFTASPAVSPYTYRLTTTKKCWNASRYECLSYGGDLAHKGIREFANRK